MKKTILNRAILILVLFFGGFVVLGSSSQAFSQNVSTSVDPVTLGYWNQNSNDLPAGGFGFLANPDVFPQTADIGIATLSVGGGFLETSINSNGEEIYTYIQSFGGSTINALNEDPAGGSISFQGGPVTDGSAANNGSYAQIMVSMVGYENLTISYATRGTATGFNTQTWSWSTDGTSFTDFETISGTNATSFFLATTEAPSNLDGVETAYLRVTFNGATNATGNNRVDNILLTATPTDGGGIPTTPTSAAPTPTVDAESVISLFSDAYTNIEGINFNPFWGQSTQVSFEEIDGNNMLKYSNFNYQGTDFPTLNVSGKTTVHLDMWTADATTVNFTIISPGPQEKLFPLEITPGQWVSYEIPLSYFNNVNLAEIFQLKFDGGNGSQTIYLDNIYFSGEGEVVVPAPPMPVGFVMNTGAGSGQIFFAAGPNQVGGDIAYRLFYSLTSAIPGDPTTATEYEFGSIPGDGGGTNAFGFNLSGLEPGVSYTSWLYQYNTETEVFSTPAQNQANAGGSVAGSEPTTAAPTPTEDPANVISIFSDAYSNIDGVNFNPFWGQSTQVSFLEIEGNNTLKYANFNYQGTEFPTLDASAMTTFHLDMWTADATTVNFTVISPGAEKLFNLPVTAGQWVSYEIPLSFFDNVNLAEIFQLKFDGGNSSQTIYLDNLYFSVTGGEVPTEPTTAAPTPTEDPANVISIFSDAYTNIDGVNFNPFWGQSTQVSFVEIEGNNTMKYSNFNYQGTEFPTLDASAMTTFHLDMWTADATTVNFTVISPGAEKLFNLPVTAGQWVSYEIPLSYFDNVNLAEIFQLKFDGGNGSQTIYLDNLYFSGEPDIVGEHVTFSVNMNYQEGLGVFQPEVGDLVFVRGSFNGWSTVEGQEMIETTPGVFEVTIFVEGEADAEHAYKYYIMAGDNRDLPNTGWEINGVGPVGNNGDRLLVLVGEDQVLDTVWFNNEEGTNTNHETEIPLEITLNQNYPNPFNPSTQIQYALPESGQVRLDVYTITGQLVATLVNETMNAGTHSITFNANSLASGVYLYRLQTGSVVLTKKMTLLK